MRAKLLIHVQGDLAIRTRSKVMSAILQLAPLPFKIIELPVNDDVNALILVSNRLIAGRQVDNTQPRVAQPNALIWRQPGSLAVRTAMIERFRGACERLGRDRFIARKKCRYTAHKNSRWFGV